MKTLKSIKYLLAVALLTGPVYSCKDYLEVEPVSQYGPDYVFSNVENATKALYGVYGCLGGDQGYGIRISMYYPYDNDEMMGQSGPSGDNERRDIARYNAQPGNTQLSGPFNQLYRGIERANICIYYIPKMAGYDGNAELQRLHGEALTLRAQFYYELIRNWGDVPAQFVPSSFADDLFLSKRDRNEIYDIILADLADAAELLPWRTEVPAAERVTQGAARALRARIALARGGYSLNADGVMVRPADYKSFYQIASDESKIIIDNGAHQLNQSFKSVFKDYICAHQIEPNGEVIWEVGVTGGSSATGDSKLGYYNGPRWDGRGNSALSVLPTTFYAYDPADTRRDVTCAPYNVNANGTKAGRRLMEMPDGKFRRDWTANPSYLNSTGQYFSINWPLIRYSDVLLMYAEAENELHDGPTEDAVTQFEKVRLRAFGGDEDAIGETPTDYDGFFTALVQERMLELCGEGIRKFDLIRWNLLGTRLAEVKEELADLVAGNPPYENLPAVMYFDPNATEITWMNSFYEPSPETPPSGATAVNWVNAADIQGTIIDVLGSGFEAGKSELLPFHTTTIEANTKIKQNKGYE